MAISTALTPADLATVTAFAGLPDEALDWLLITASREFFPDTKRVLLTAYADTEAAG